ncbi:MAG: DUF4258 domain-containing protein [Nitrospirales bacterium]
MDYQLTEHARESLRKRPSIRIEWVEQVLLQPERVEPDRIDPELEHRMRRIQEAGERVLRVIVKKTSNPIRVITCYFDRKMGRQL